MPTFKNPWQGPSGVIIDKMEGPDLLKKKHEITHGKMLAQDDPEYIWGWGTPAGRLRALRRSELISKAASLGADVKALEVGCGTGMFTEMFARKGAQLIAVDISPELLAIARARGLPEDRVRFVEKQFEDCDIDGPFDAVIGSSVLHHLNIEKALERIYALLKPGGIMSFAEPNMINPQVFLERKFNFLPYFWYVSPDETAFVRHRLKSILNNAGFEQISITPFDWLHPATPRDFIRAVTMIGHLLERLPVIREFAGSLLIHCRRPKKEE